uniref:Uncharacterized protein n=1 Tax=Catharus ustulatus TaxID=91951 RepID=A0A8C3U5Y4_CATUS
KFPGAVHESGAEQASLPQVQGLLNPCRGQHSSASPGSSQGWPPTSLTSLGSREMKSRWNWGSMTCIMYLICAGSQRSMSSSRASSFSGPLQRCKGTPSDSWLCVPS